MNDIYVSTALISLLICHLAAIIIGYQMHKQTLIMSYLNMGIAIGAFVFWAITSLNIKQHNFQFIELLALFIEACILIFAFVSIIGFHNKTAVKVINFIGFGIHLLVTTGMLIYMLTFKFNRLF
ncbi:hypothetical protein ES676_10885 [Bizionia saleffrena]|uniref:Uncharacterized protein n=1 Tax=Bizionia saleffrena TaxID=291189 RepID=A0A8H2LFZ8_9FLAO|nr:hypothetical protein [Bizionia saleffrena]TYB72671.1 hypothetical protein ES676_10885 [Bizionia saleffrena]